MDVNKKPLISILIPAYNQPDYTRECLESVFMQTGFTIDEVEVIMVDDFSPQDLTNLGMEFETKYPNFHFERARNNRGMAGNWNYLLQLKKGKYFIFLSNDDTFATPDALRTTYDALLNNQADVCYGKYLCINESNELSDFIPHRKIGNQDIFWDMYSPQLKRHSISFGGILYKDFGYLYDVGAGMWADWDYNLQYLANTKKVLLINTTTLYYRVHSNQGSSGMNYRNYIKASFYIIGKQTQISDIRKIKLYCYHVRIMISTFFIVPKILFFLKKLGLFTIIQSLYKKFHA